MVIPSDATAYPISSADSLYYPLPPGRVTIPLPQPTLASPDHLKSTDNKHFYSTTLTITIK